MDIITQLFSRIDFVAASAIQTIYQSLASGLLPVFTVALTIYVAYWGYEMIYGGAPFTAGSFIWRIVRIAVIYSLAFGWSDFSTLIVNTFTQGGDGVASAVARPSAAPIAARRKIPFPRRSRPCSPMP